MLFSASHDEPDHPKICDTNSEAEMPVDAQSEIIYLPLMRIHTSVGKID